MNRKQRRLLEKQLGLMKKYQSSTKVEQQKIRQRRREMGEKLRLQNFENNYNAQQQAEEKRQIDFIQEMVNRGFSTEEAKNILDHNFQIEEKRIQKIKGRARKTINSTQTSEK
jgi:hypothetical protein